MKTQIQTAGGKHKDLNKRKNLDTQKKKNNYKMS